MWAGRPLTGEVKIRGGRFVFDAKAIASLREKAASERVPNPTLVETVSGFIWKCMMKASRAKSGIGNSRSTYPSYALAFSSKNDNSRNYIE